MAQRVNKTYTEEPGLRIANETTISQKTPLSNGKAFFDNKLFRAVTPLFYSERSRITFEVSEEFKSRMALLRGLIEFTRSPLFVFRYNFTQATFETDVHPSNIGDLERFFEDVLKLMEAETRFKKALKAVIAFEKDYKQLSAAVYAGLSSAVQ